MSASRDAQHVSRAWKTSYNLQALNAGASRELCFFANSQLADDTSPEPQSCTVCSWLALPATWTLFLEEQSLSVRNQNRLLSFQSRRPSRQSWRKCMYRIANCKTGEKLEAFIFVLSWQLSTYLYTKLPTRKSHETFEMPLRFMKKINNLGQGFFKAF